MRNRKYRVIIDIVISNKKKKDNGHELASDEDFIRNELGWITQSLEEYKIINIKSFKEKK